MSSKTVEEIKAAEKAAYDKCVAEEGEEVARKKKEATEIIALQFYSKHPNLKRNEPNGHKLYTHLVTHNLPFDVESLEEAYEQLQDSLEHLSDRETRLAGATAAAKQEEATKKPAYPWGEKLTNMTLARMSGKDFLKWKEIPEFKRQLEVLGIRS